LPPKQARAYGAPPLSLLVPCERPNSSGRHDRVQPKPVAGGRSALRPMRGGRVLVAFVAALRCRLLLDEARRGCCLLIPA
jgi:hypothetical protein